MSELCGLSIFVSVLQDGIVLGADTRSTAGSTVADKNCEKIHYIAPNIYCCGAGTAADTENVTGKYHEHWYFKLAVNSSGHASLPTYLRLDDLSCCSLCKT